MSGDRFNYYLKTILNASFTDYLDILDQISNDPLLQDYEVEELERLVKRSMSSQYSRFRLRVVNSKTGEEESPPQTTADNFGESSQFVGEEKMYGLNWEAYSPKENFSQLGIKKWYYNEIVALAFDQALLATVPGNFPSYFHVPPWVLGTHLAPNTRYVPIPELVNSAITSGLIPSWDYLVLLGVPREFVRFLQTASADSSSKPQ
ncbi:MAG: hypothetical protein M1151_06590 [Candidatus Thermoplasmatota archaeon]|jgi:hypothetical protein|nr:hypothetical protein [Candidatus Thermoplasmatota archaeon]